MSTRVAAKPDQTGKTRVRATTPGGTHSSATLPMAGDPGTVHNLLERLGIYFSGGAFADEAAAAREAYFAATGELFEEDEDLFEPRMAAFLEWYVLEWAQRARKTTAATIYLAEVGAGLSDAERDALTRLTATRRSLYSVKKVAANEVLLEDLLAPRVGAGKAAPAPLAARERRGTIGFSKGDLCEARLVASDGAFIFSKTLLFHPRDAGRAIRAAIEAARRAGDPLGDFPFRLARLHQRWHRQGHVAADKIYREGLTRQK